MPASFEFEPLSAARIPARSRRQAMDWSLVLLSQGIESTIQQPADGGGWALVVEPEQYTNALGALRQYQVENRGWRWRQSLPGTASHFDWGSVAWAALLCVFHALSQNRPGFRESGVMDSAAVAAGQWWRVFTAMLLHADVAHLAENLSIGIVLLGLAMGRYGTGIGLLAALCAGAGGNLLSLGFTTKPFYGLGASGMVMGALGLLAAQSLRFRAVDHAPLKHRVSGALAGVMLFILYGLTPGTDILAHFGGFVTGLILGALLTLVPAKRLQRPFPNLLAGLAFTALLAAAWWLALNRAT